LPAVYICSSATTVCATANSNTIQSSVPLLYWPSHSLQLAARRRACCSPVDRRAPPKLCSRSRIKAATFIRPPPSSPGGGIPDSKL
jgi:hypothetical protein